MGYELGCKPLQLIVRYERESLRFGGSQIYVLEGGVMVGWSFLVRQGDQESLPEIIECWAGEKVSSGER